MTETENRETTISIREPTEKLRIIDLTDLTDIGNAKALIRLFGDKLRYCHPWKSWLCWNGKYWERDQSGQIFRYAKQTTDEILRESCSQDGELQERIRKHAINSKSYTKIKAMVALAESDESITIMPERFDNHKMFLSVDNGTIELETGACREFEKLDYITKKSKIPYVACATSPLWLKFMDTITVGDVELSKYLQKIAGKILTGLVLDKELYIFHGKKDTGKTTFVETVAYIVEEFSETLDIDAFMKKSRGGIPNDIAALSGKRFVFIDEPDFGDKLSEGLIKKLTGLGTINARFLNEEFFKFKPEFKIVISCNSQPDITDKDQAIWGRVRCVPFLAKIRDIDRKLQEKLRAEASGILNWMIQGCLDWQREGMNIPESVNRATENYKEDMDTLSDFFNICCIQDDDLQIPHEYLYTAFKLWASAIKRQPMSKKAFTQVCENRDFERTNNLYIGNQRCRGFKGLFVNQSILKSVQDFLTSADNEYESVRTVCTHITDISGRYATREGYVCVRDMCSKRSTCSCIMDLCLISSSTSVQSVRSVQEKIISIIQKNYNKYSKPDSIIILKDLKRSMKDFIEVELDKILPEGELPEKENLEEIISNWCRTQGWG